MQCLEKLQWKGDTPEQMRLFNEEWDKLVTMVRQYNKTILTDEWVRHLYSTKLGSSHLLKREIENFRYGRIHNTDPQYKAYYSYKYLRDAITVRLRHAEIERQDKAMANVNSMTTRFTGPYLNIHPTGDHAASPAAPGESSGRQRNRQNKKEKKEKQFNKEKKEKAEAATPAATPRAPSRGRSEDRSSPTARSSSHKSARSDACPADPKAGQQKGKCFFWNRKHFNDSDQGCKHKSSECRFAHEAMTRGDYIAFCKRMDKTFKALAGDPATPATSPRARSPSPGPRPRSNSRDKGQRRSSPRGQRTGKGRNSRDPSPSTKGKIKLCREYYWTGHCRFQTNGKSCIMAHVRKDDAAKDSSKYVLPRAWVSSSKKGSGKGRGKGPRGSPGPRKKFTSGVRGKWKMRPRDPAAPAVCSDEPKDSTMEWCWSQDSGVDGQSWESEDWAEEEE